FIILLLSAVVSAQEEETPHVDVLNCSNGSGCERTVSSLTQEEAEVVLGEAAPEGQEAPFVVCADGLGCMWSHVTAEEADIVFGGDGVDDLVFEEDEGLEIILEEGDSEESEIELTFTEEEVIEFTEGLCANVEECEW